MSGETTLTVIGNLTADPELRFTPSGSAVANFTIASTPRTFDKDSNQWKDGDTLFLRCSIWRETAENVTESLHKGDRVIAEGFLKQRKYTPKEGGDERTVFEMEVQEIGASLKYARIGAIAKADTSGRTPQQGQQQGQQQGGYQQPAQQGWGGQQQAPAQGNWNQNAAQQAVTQQAQAGYQTDPWVTPQQQPAQGQWNGQQQGQQPSF